MTNKTDANCSCVDEVAETLNSLIPLQFNALPLEIKNWVGLLCRLNHPPSYIVSSVLNVVTLIHYENTLTEKFSPIDEAIWRKICENVHNGTLQSYKQVEEFYLAELNLKQKKSRTPSP